MNRLLFVCFVFMIGCKCHSQVVIGSRYNPMTFGEMMAPLQMAQAAFERAAQKFESNMDKASECWNSGNYSQAKYYIKKCQEINNDFKGRFCNPDDIAKSLADCDRMIKKQQEAGQNDFTAKTSGSGGNFKLYSNNQYSIFYPSDWKCQENINEMTDVYIGSERVGIGFAIVRIFTSALLEDANNEAIANSRKNGISVSDNRLIKINGIDCYRNILNMTINGIKVKQISYTLKKGNYLYNIKFGNDAKLVDANLTTIEMIVNSLTFK